jgi:nucleoside-diphosphate-sugar epimerase
MAHLAKRKRILITGATGFLGSALVRFLEEDHEIFALYRDPSSVPSLTATHWIRQDLREQLCRAALPKRIDVIIHMAYVGRQAPPRRESDIFTVNSACCASLLAYAVEAGARHFVYGSTGGIYGRRARPSRESTKPKPYDYYTLSKHQGECLILFQPRWVPVIVRYYYPYGPGQTNGIIPKIRTWIENQQPIVTYNRAKNPWINPVHIDDACELTMRAMALGEPIIVNCAGADKTTLLSKLAEIQFVPVD